MPCTSTPSPAIPSRSSRPPALSPTMPMNAVFAPARAAAIAWFWPLPPAMVTSSCPSTVSPGPGRRSPRVTTSRLMDPTTQTSTWRAIAAPYPSTSLHRRGDTGDERVDVLVGRVPSRHPPHLTARHVPVPEEAPLAQRLDHLARQAREHR